MERSRKELKKIRELLKSVITCCQATTGGATLSAVLYASFDALDNLRVPDTVTDQAVRIGLTRDAQHDLNDLIKMINL